jgi:hypothetical protein
MKLQLHARSASQTASSSRPCCHSRRRRLQRVHRPINSQTQSSPSTAKFHTCLLDLGDLERLVPVVILGVQIAWKQRITLFFFFCASMCERRILREVGGDKALIHAHEILHGGRLWEVHGLQLGELGPRGWGAAGGIVCVTSVYLY